LGRKDPRFYKRKERMKTINCKYCGQERAERGNDGYFSEDGTKFLHFECIFRLLEGDIWRKLRRERKE
jgi:hypothetical protein